MYKRRRVYCNCQDDDDDVMHDDGMHDDDIDDANDINHDIVDDAEDEEEAVRHEWLPPRPPRDIVISMWMGYDGPWRLRRGQFRIRVSRRGPYQCRFHADEYMMSLIE